MSPVVGLEVDLEGLRRDRDLLWAEALDRYQAGEKWYLTDKAVIAEATKEQAARYESHPWQEVIGKWLDTEGMESVTTSEILERCVGKPRDRWEHRDKIAIGGCMKSLGWTKRRPRSGDRERCYVKP